MKDIYEKYIIENNNKVTFNVLENFNFAYDVIDEIAAQDSNKRALVYKSCSGDLKEFSFGDISRFSNKAANALRNRGIGHGDKVMLIMKRRYQFWYVMMALHKLGAVGIPTSHMVSDKDISYRLKNADVKAVICAGDDYICGCVDIALGDDQPYNTDVIKYVVADSEREGYFNLDDEIDAASEVFERQKTCVTDTMLLYFTSGTTGEPKAVIHNYSYPLSHILTARDWHGVVDGGLHFTIADSGWAKSAWGKMYGQWFCGCAVMVYDYDQFFANEILEIMQDCKVTSFCAPPTVYKYMLREDIENYDLSSVQQVVTAGEAMPIAIDRKFKEKTGLQIRCGFGQTETALLIAVMKGDKQREDTIGKASPMYDVHIVDDDCKEVKPGEIGEIVIYPDNNENIPVGIFDGYLNDNELYKKIWENGIYHTKDKAYCDEDGYFYFVSRSDDVIKSSGYRIGPSEVENVIMHHPAVFECAVTGYPSPTRGNIVKATIVLHEGFEPTNKLKVEIQDFVRDRTAMYKYPRMVEFIDDLPKTISGKIQREVIRQRDLDKLARK